MFFQLSRLEVVYAPFFSSLPSPKAISSLAFVNPASLFQRLAHNIFFFRNLDSDLWLFEVAFTHATADQTGY
jgi:hypothetical protein